jgi:hypothetical protein
MLIDVSISGGRNVMKKEVEKITKYKDCTIEIERVWNLKPKVIPVIMGAPGAISKSFRKYLSNNRESTTSRNCRKQPYWVLCRHTWESTNVKTLNVESNITRTITVTTE